MREIQAISYRDRIVQHSLCDNLLIPVLEKHLIDANCACRKNKGTDFAIKKLRSFMAAHYRKYGCNGYFIKLDIHKYFPSINHQVILRKLEVFNFSDDVMYLIKLVISSFPENGSGVGLPMGNQSSQCFALLCLDKTDRFIKEVLHIKNYVRYMDDMILLVPTKKQAQTVLTIVEKKINEEQLELNPKSGIIPVKNGIEFLGWRFSYSSTGKIVQKVKKSSKKRITSKVKEIKYKFRKNTERINASMVSYKGHLLRGDGNNFYYKLVKM